MNAMNQILWQEITERLGWALVHSLWQVTVIGVVLAILLRWLRRASANVRYLLASLALLLMVLAPLLTAVSMSSPLARSLAPAQAAATVSPSPSVPRETEELATSSPPPAPASASSDWWSSPHYWRLRGREVLELGLPHAVSGWLLGVLGLSLWQFGGWVRLQRLKNQSIRPVDAPLVDRLARLTAALGIERTVQLVESALVQVPVVVGWLRPMILLPTSALTGLKPAQLEALLAHELAHVRRHDYLVNVLQTVIEILCFYHPVMWWVSRRVRIERENCCDDVAVQLSGDKVRYIKALASMEDLRAGQPALALAAAGGSLLARMRRLVGRAPSENGPSTWTPLLAVAAILILVVPAALAWAEYTSDPATELERTILEGFTRNRDKFTCGTLAWTWSLRQYPSIPGMMDSGMMGMGRPLRGDFQMWWDGEKVATQYVTDRICTGSRDPNQERTWVEKVEGSNVYDGGLLSRKPRFGGHENWLEDVIRWRGRQALDQEILAERRLEHVESTWSVVDVNGTRLISSVTRNLRTGGSDCDYYDPAKGYGLVKEEWHTPEGRTYFRHVFKLEEVIPGGWFPVEATIDLFNPRTGTRSSRNHLLLELSRCRFNDRAALPEGVFNRVPKRQQDELDRVLEAIAQDAPTDEAEAITRNPRRTVESFIRAVMAGEDEKAAVFLGRQPADDLEQFRELAAGQDLRIVTVCADGTSALAVTSAMRADHGRAGPLTFELTKGSGREAGDWRITDIDVETVQKAGRDVEAFLKEHPQARMLFAG